MDLEISLDNWINCKGFFKNSCVRKTLTINSWESNYGFWYNLELHSNCAELVIKIGPTGSIPLNRDDRNQILCIYSVLLSKLEEILDVQIDRNSFFEYIIKKIQKGKSNKIYLTYIQKNKLQDLKEKIC